MLLYLDLAYAQAKAEARLRSRDQLHDAIIEGAAKRIRPKFMTAATLLGLVKAAHEAEILAEIGVILLLFTIGVKISFANLLQR